MKKSLAFRHNFIRATKFKLPKKKKSHDSEAFSFCAFHYSLFTFHSSLKYVRLFQIKDKREEIKDKRKGVAPPRIIKTTLRIDLLPPLCYNTLKANMF